MHWAAPSISKQQQLTVLKTRWNVLARVLSLGRVCVKHKSYVAAHLLYLRCIKGKMSGNVQTAVPERTV